MPEISKSANRHRRRLFRHRIKWPVSENRGKVLLFWWTQLELEGVNITV